MAGAASASIVWAALSDLIWSASSATGGVPGSGKIAAPGATCSSRPPLPLIGFGLAVRRSSKRAFSGPQEEDQEALRLPASGRAMPRNGMKGNGQPPSENR